MRRTLSVIAAAMIAATLLAIAGVAAAQPETQLQMNRAAAQRDARKLLALLRLPKDLRRSAARPRVGGTLLGERSANGRYYAGDQAYWTTNAEPQAIMAYIKAHRPAGAAIETLGSSTAPETALDVTFTWPALGLRVYGRTMWVSVISAPGSPSAVVAQSQSSWMVPRSSAERVPPAVRSVAITLRMGGGTEGIHGHMHISTYVVWRTARVAALVNEFNRLPIVQPGVSYACPLELVGPHRPALTLQFRAGQAGPALARAEIYVSPGNKGDAGWNMCNPIQFWIGGKQQISLTSQTFVRQIGRLIGANIS
jgi:hypothetical protein